MVLFSGRAVLGTRLVLEFHVQAVHPFPGKRYHRIGWEDICGEVWSPCHRGVRSYRGVAAAMGVLWGCRDGDRGVAAARGLVWTMGSSGPAENPLGFLTGAVGVWSRWLVSWGGGSGLGIESFMNFIGLD
jgi:hypothetical protein